MVTLVAGPPCAGKTTWVRERAQPDEEVLDYDEVCAAVSGCPLYVQPPALRDAVDREFRRRLATIGGGYVIRCAADNQQRAILARHLGAAVVVLETPAAVCLARLAASGRPAAVKDDQRLAIHRWWSIYKRSSRAHESHIGGEPKRSREW